MCSNRESAEGAPEGRPQPWAGWQEGALRGLWVTSAWEKCREGSKGFAGGRCHPQLGERGGAPGGGEAGWWRWHPGRALHA